MSKPSSIDSTKKKLIENYDFRNVEQLTQKRIKREDQFEKYVMGTKNFDVTLKLAKIAYGRAKEECLNATTATARAKLIMKTFNDKRYKLRISRIADVELHIWLYRNPVVEEEEWLFILKNVAQWVEEDKGFYLSLTNVESLGFKTFSLNTLDQLVPGWTLIVRTNLSFFRWHVAGILQVVFEANVFDSNEKFVAFREASLASQAPSVYTTTLKLRDPIHWSDLPIHLNSSSGISMCMRYDSETFEWDPDMCSVQDLLRPYKQNMTMRILDKVIQRCYPGALKAMTEYQEKVDEFVTFSDKICDRVYWMSNLKQPDRNYIQIGVDVVVTSDNAMLM